MNTISITNPYFIILISIILIAYCLLPIAHCVMPVAYCWGSFLLLPTRYCGRKGGDHRARTIDRAAQEMKQELDRQVATLHTIAIP